jgi:hypothetical protein
MDPFLHLARENAISINVFTKLISKDEVINFIKSVDFTGAPFDDTTASDESSTADFITSFFISLSETVLEHSPPKTSPKKIIEGTLFQEPDTPTKSHAHVHPAHSTGNASQAPCEALDNSFPNPHPGI